MSQQDQFLDVIDRDEAERRFHAALRLAPLGDEQIELDGALGRVLARDVTATVDVPSFDRSNYDGFAVRAADTYGATEELPRRLTRLGGVLAPSVVPSIEVNRGEAIAIATGGMLPRGADAVVMVEHADDDGEDIVVRRAVTPGFGVSFAGTDIGTGETVLRRGEVLTSRETGVLAAIGTARVTVWKRPQVAIVSTGDEIIRPGEPMRPGKVFDSNARILADAVTELGGVPVDLGIVRDDLEQLREMVHRGIASADIVLLSGGTSKGEGDMAYRVLGELSDPGIVAHGVALKPGKPICLAVSRGKPVVILPGFPTSAIFTFHEFVAPLIGSFAGRPVAKRSSVHARMAIKVISEIGRTEYLLVGLIPGADASSPLAAYPMGKGSGSVTAFSRADGFVTIGRHDEIIEPGAEVDVTLIGERVEPADLVVIGSHCVGLDYLLGELQDRGYRTKFLAVGSTAGLDAARRGECDLAGIHLLDPESGQYNKPYLSDDLQLIAGYGRTQGIVFRPGDPRFEKRAAADAIASVKEDPRCVMVNRNQGSGTRLLMDQVLAGSRPAGYAVQSRNHNAVAAAVAQQRADWGLAIQSVAAANGLGFLPVQDEQYDFVVANTRSERPAVIEFRRLLGDAEIQQQLRQWGFTVATPPRGG